MSRSYKKNPVIKDSGKHKQFGKKQANKKVRHSECSNGSNFKKLFESGDICEWMYWTDKTKRNISK